MAKKLKVGMLVCASLLMANTAYANYPTSNEVLAVTQQTSKIRGTVVDSNMGDPIIGASVKVKGTKLAAVTDIDGNFEINAPANATLVISYVGYKDIELKASNGMKVSLEEDTESLEEVVVVGYGTQKKESLTGAMTNIKADKLKDITSASVENMLNGKVSGVYVAPGGGPGATGAVVIRGQTSINGATAPLWVIDGVIVGNSSGNLNPDDIETMTVLKDAASTAIYGSEGANGVVVVTTKQARQDKTTITFAAKAGLSTLDRGNLEMMDGAEFYDYYKSFQNVESVNFPRWNEDLRNQNFDWYKFAKQTGNTQDYNITINGGSDKIQSMFTMGYYKEEGAVKGYDLNRYSARIKVTYKPYKWLTVKPNLSGSRKDTKDKQYDISSMFSMMPWDSPYDEDGNIVPNQYSGWVNSKGTNFLYDLSCGNYSSSRTYDLAGGFDFDIKITPWLTFSSVNNYSYYDNQDHGYYDPKSSAAGGDVNGRLTEYYYQSTRRYTNQLLRFQKTFGKHNVNGLLAYEFNDYEMKYTDVYKTGFIPGFEDFYTAAKPERATGYRTAWAKQSYFTQWRYDYAGKYLAEFSLRRDGRSNFGANNRYGNFYSVSAGWNINNEDWFKADWVDQLKLRASIGSVGNVPTSLYPSYSLYSVGSSYNEVSGALISQIGNKELTWEKTVTSGIGVDASFWQNRLHATLDYYVKNTSNILYRVPVTGLVGVTSIWKNIGKMRNTGIELTVGGDIIRTKDLTWNLTASISHNSNELRDLYKQRDANGNYVVKPVLINDGTSIAGTAQRILEIGEPVDTYYLKEWAGVNPEDGKPQWYMDDENGNKVVTSDYAKAGYYKCGKASPDVYGSFSTSVTYKGFDLQANFGYSIGGQIYSYFRQEYDSDGAYAGDRNQMKLQKGWTRWEKPGDIATHPRAMYNNQDKGNQASSRYLESSDYLKLRSLTLGYNFDLKKYGIQTLRVSLSGENLFTITDYSGIDPELPAANNPDGVLSVMGTGTISAYPTMRKFMLGVNITF